MTIESSEELKKMDQFFKVCKEYEIKEGYSLDEVADKLTNEMDIYTLDIFEIKIFNEIYVANQFGLNNYFKHLKERVKNIKNSYVLSRYYEVLWIYESKYKNDIYRVKMIKAIIKTIEERKITNDFGVEMILEKALLNSNKKDEFKNKIVELIIQRGKDNKNSNWAYNLIKKSTLASEGSKTKALNLLKDQFKDEDISINKYVEIGKILIKIYKTNENEIGVLIENITKRFKELNDNPLKKKILLEKLIYELKKRKVTNKKKEKLNDLALEFGKEVKLTPIESSIEITNVELEQIKNQYTCNSFKESILHILYGYLGGINRARDCYLEHSISSLANLFSATITDNKGRTVATANTEDEKLIYNIAKYLQFEFVFFKSQMDKILEKFGEKGLEKLIDDSIHCENTDKEFIKKCIELYTNEDYILFLHLAIPRIENILRNFLKSLGGSIIGNVRNDGFNYKILGDILNDDLIKETFTDDLILYLKISLSHNLGLNLRNELSHGIIEIDKCNETNSSIVFHILLFLLCM